MRTLAGMARVGVFVLAATLFSLLSPEAHAQVYKWVDAAGVTHYGEQAPENAKSKEVKLRESHPASAAVPASGAASAPAAKGNNLQDKERAFRQRQVARDEDEAKQAAFRAKREEECKAARLNLADIRQTPRLYDVNEKGERVFMSDKQRDDLIASRQEAYNQNCNQ